MNGQPVGFNLTVLLLVVIALFYQVQKTLIVSVVHVLGGQDRGRR